ncbi:MAG: hypothetical protein AAFU64_04575 [Bacteroidota bacterium]
MKNKFLNPQLFCYLNNFIAFGLAKEMPYKGLELTEVARKPGEFLNPTGAASLREKSGKYL